MTEQDKLIQDLRRKYDEVIDNNIRLEDENHGLRRQVLQLTEALAEQTKNEIGRLEDLRREMRDCRDDLCWMCGKNDPEKPCIWCRWKDGGKWSRL